MLTWSCSNRPGGSGQGRRSREINIYCYDIRNIYIRSIKIWCLTYRYLQQLNKRVGLLYQKRLTLTRTREKFFFYPSNEKKLVHSTRYKNPALCIYIHSIHWFARSDERLCFPLLLICSRTWVCGVCGPRRRFQDFDPNISIHFIKVGSIGWRDEK